MLLVFFMHTHTLICTTESKNEELKFLFLSMAKIMRLLTIIQSYLFDMQIDLWIQTIVFARILFKLKLHELSFSSFGLVYPCTLYRLNRRYSQTEMIQFGCHIHTHTRRHMPHIARGACCSVCVCVCVAAFAKRWFDALLDSLVIFVSID